jgi:hypothetical protein
MSLVAVADFQPEHQPLAAYLFFEGRRKYLSICLLNAASRNSPKKVEQIYSDIWLPDLLDSLK